jgi:hypothetical protein
LSWTIVDPDKAIKAERPWFRHLNLHFPREDCLPNCRYFSDYDDLKAGLEKVPGRVGAVHHGMKK